MIVRVWENARRARTLARVVVATDDERVARVVRDAGGEAVLTDPAIPSGTDRVLAAARRLGYRLVDHRLELYAVPLEDKPKR